MDEENESLIKAILSSAVRKILVGLFFLIVTPLVNHGWITKQIADRIQGDIAQWTTIIVAFIVLFAWPILAGAWKQVVAKAKLRLAFLADPAVHSPADVDTAVHSLPKLDVAKIATMPGNVPLPMEVPPITTPKG